MVSWQGTLCIPGGLGEIYLEGNCRAGPGSWGGPWISSPPFGRSGVAVGALPMACGPRCVLVYAGGGWGGSDGVPGTGSFGCLAYFWRRWDFWVWFPGFLFGVRPVRGRLLFGELAGVCWAYWGLRLWRGFPRGAAAAGPLLAWLACG